jgi:hypothetical protein
VITPHQKYEKFADLCCGIPFLRSLHFYVNPTGFFRILLIVEWNFPLIVDAGAGLSLSTRRAGVLASPGSMLRQQAHGNFQAELPILVRSERQSVWQRFAAHSDASTCLKTAPGRGSTIQEQIP